MSTDLATVVNPPARMSLIERMASRLQAEPGKLVACLKGTCFKSDRPITDEQLMALVIVGNQYNLNPLTRELFAFPDKHGGIIPYVSYDGWARIINEHPQYDGCEFAWDQGQQSITCTIYRKDRTHPTVITEYMVECRRATDPWNKSPRRMLRNRSLMQCGRLAFGFAGLYDEDEAARIRDGGFIEQRAEPAPSSQRAGLAQMLHGVIDATPVPLPPQDDEGAPEGTLATLTAEILAADDRDCAGEVLDRGRSILGDEEFSELAANFSAAWDNV